MATVGSITASTISRTIAAGTARGASACAARDPPYGKKPRRHGNRRADHRIDHYRHHLLERVRVIRNAPLGTNGEFVLYWMHHAGRSHENPALDTALYVAALLKLPVLVYQGLGGRHPFNSNLHHTFTMEGAALSGMAMAGRVLGVAAKIQPNDQVSAE